MRSDHNIPFRGALLASAIALAALAAGAPAQTYNLRVLHRFSGGPDDGNGPGGVVQFDAAGNLYGTTGSGGVNNAGTIFKIAKDGTETIVHSFDGATGGSGPERGVTIDPATGDLYGTTIRGGNLSACPDISGSGCGVLYKLAADATFTVLHAFNPADGSGYPDGRPLRDRQGNLYGTTYQLGTTSTASIYKYSANGTFTVLHEFPAQDGYPAGGVIRDRVGNLYGVTNLGGINLDGAVYKLAPDGSYTTLHSFTGIDGRDPAGGLTGDEAGNLYGATTSGGTANWGTVFKLAPDGSLTTLYDFTRGADGGGPNGDLLLIGDNLYGTTVYGGSDNPNCFRFYIDDMCGVAFKLAPDGTETILHAFVPREGAPPTGGLTLKYGRLFGTTGTTVHSGGGTSSGGTVYSVGVATQ